MSLGVKQLWRALSNSNGARGLSLIPRECAPALTRAAPTSRSTLRALHSRLPLSDQSQSEDIHSHDELEANDVQHTTTEVHDSGEYKTPTDPSRASPPPPPPPPREAQEQAQTRARNVRDKGPGLVNRLAKVPVRAHPALESVFVRPVTEYPDQYETRGSVRSHRKDNARQKKVLGTRVPTDLSDWRATLRKLYQWTPMCLPEQFADTVKVIMPRETAPRLLSDSEWSVWDIKSRTGCRMVLYRYGDAGYEEGTEDHDPYLILKGYHRSVNTAIDEILSVTRRVTVISRTQDTEEVLWDGKVAGQDLSLPAPSVYVYARRTPSPLAPYNVNIRADEFPKPEEWTRKTFEEYVDVLIKSRMPPSLASKLYPEHGRHELAVIEQLVAVFNDEVAAQFVSNAAFKMALHYMTRGGETWRPELLSLFNYAQSGRRMQLDVEVFNILAEAAVKTRSLYRFSQVLYLMVTRGYQPNLRTWILFLRMFEAEEVKRYVLQAMNDRGLFNAHGALRMIANEMAPHDAYRAVQLRWDVPTFLAKQDELYGRERKWVSIDAINKIIHVFGSYSKFAEIRQLLDLIFTGELVAYPDQVTVNTILTHCKAQRKLDLAVEFIQLFEGHNADNNTKTPLKLDKMACDILFDLANWQKKPHVLSTIWRYAHLVNATTSEMRRRGTNLLAMDETELKKEKLVRRLKLGDEERVQFLRQLLIGEFIQANGGEQVFGKVIAGIAKGEQEHQRGVEEMAEQEEEDNEGIPTALGDWFQSQSLVDSSSPTTPPSSSSSPTSSNPSQPNPNHNILQSHSSEQTEPITWGNIYGSFQSWSFTSQFLHLEPSAPIGSLLQQALERDRELHLALREDGLDRLDVEELMKPIEIPTQSRTKPAFAEVRRLFMREREAMKRGVEKVGVKEGDRDGDGEVQEAMAFGTAMRRQAVDQWSGGGGGDGEAAAAAKNASVDEAASAAAAAKPKPSSPPKSKKVVVTREQKQQPAAATAAAAATVEAEVEVEVEAGGSPQEEEAHKRGERKATPSKPKTPPAPAPVAEAQKTSPTIPPTLSTPPTTSSPPSTKTPTKSSKERKTKEAGVEPPLPSSSEKRVKWEDLADL